MNLRKLNFLKKMTTAKKNTKKNTKTTTTKMTTTTKASSPRDFIEAENNSQQVVIWSKSYCPYCKATKQLFNSMKGVEVVVHELDNMKDGAMIQQELLHLTGQRSVPNVFVQGRHVGGNDDTQAAHQNGRLQDLLLMEYTPAKLAAM
ncbi:Glutaredoxin-2, mitochondrial [Seminavis robusta]|uniref:Glutaredoxin-2, mitochondrial n=1 Tax=Seminavis robusta TaxID=568900 RepID=A0A9N8H5J0_9STRA|nr:Glutaredoxin-2, mitochondrial [Seminavis robusta]|eukprot:Sro144_g066920.1 Glutaredoxin-2, mitochondrial (147) ;mRNA; f:28006-28559